MYPYNLPLLAPAYIPAQSLKGPHFEAWTRPEPETTSPAFILKPDLGPNAKFTEGVKTCTTAE